MDQEVKKKICRVCGVPKYYKDYCPNASYANGRDNTCYQCRKELRIARDAKYGKKKPVIEFHNWNDDAIYC